MLAALGDLIDAMRTHFGAENSNKRKEAQLAVLLDNSVAVTQAKLEQKSRQTRKSKKHSKLNKVRCVPMDAWSHSFTAIDL